MIFNYVFPFLNKKSDLVSGLTFLMVFMASLGGSLIAQSAHCHADELMADYALKTQNQQEIKIYKQGLTNVINSRSGAAIISLPVVFHIIHQGESIGNGPNLSDSEIQEQLDILNNDFSLQNTDKARIPSEFEGRAANVEIQFCLAKVAPSGVSTTGIERVQFQAVTSINEIETKIKPQTQWDPENYINIWILRMPNPSFLGYAYLPIPSILGTALDGIVISHLKVGNINPSTKGRTLVHEMGHYLGLLHIWGFNENECNEDDQISDTPKVSAPYYGCPAYPQFTCGTSDMFMNYMDYVDDNCMHMFTEGQRSIMRAVATKQRSSLLNGVEMACNSTVAVAPSPKINDLVKLYPNPCQDQLQVSLPDNQEIKSYRLFDTSGRLLYTNVSELSLRPRIERFDTSALQDGIYLVRIETKSGESYVKRFVKLN